MTSDSPLPQPRDFPVPAAYQGVTLPGIGRIHIWGAEDPFSLLDISRYKNEFDEKDELMPYWADIWTSSWLLAVTLATDEIKLNGTESVLELGAGTGLPGLTAAKAGCSVTLTDIAEDALEILKIHLRENQIPVDARCRITELDMLHPEKQGQVSSSEYDVILGADILYEQRMGQPVFETLQKYLQRDGIAVIVDPCRDTASTFKTALKQAQWPYEEMVYSPKELIQRGINNPRKPCRLFRISRCQKD